MLKEMGEKFGAADRQAIEGAVETLKKAVESTRAAAIQRALDQLTAAQHKAAEALYKQQAPGGPRVQAPRRARTLALRQAQGRPAPAARERPRAMSSTRKWWTRGNNEIAELQDGRIAERISRGHFPSCNYFLQSCNPAIL